MLHDEGEDQLVPQVRHAQVDDVVPELALDGVGDALDDHLAPVELHALVQQRRVQEHRVNVA